MGTGKTDRGTEGQRDAGTVDCRLAIVDCRATDSTPLKRVKLVPWGTVRSDRGEYIVDEESAVMTGTRFIEHANGMVVDYEHGSEGGEFTPPEGIAPAAGWIEKIEGVPGDGIYGLVKWNERAAAMIRADEYRYLSPTLLVRKSDRKVVGIKSVGLVNQPAIHGMEKVAAKDRGGKAVKAMDGETMTGGLTPGQILKLGQIVERRKLSVEDPNNLDAVLDALLGEKGGGDGKAADGKAADTAANKAVCKALGLTDGASESEMILAINSAKQNAKAAEGLAAKLNMLEQKLMARDTDDLLKPYFAANKINPNDTLDVEVCRDLAAKDPAKFAKYMAARQPYAEPGKTTPPAGGATGNGREGVIATACKEFDAHPELALLTSKQAAVDDALRMKGLKALSKDEVEKLS